MATAARCNRFEVRVNYCGPSACLVYAFERFERESYEREREKERERGGENDEGGRNGERSAEERSICSGMHSALIALSASRIYTLLRAEPLKKPSFTLPLHETSPVPSRATSPPIVKSRNFEARCALPVAKMDDPPDTRYRRETFSDLRR